MNLYSLKRLDWVEDTVIINHIQTVVSVSATSPDYTYTIRFDRREKGYRVTRFNRLTEESKNDRVEPSLVDAMAWAEGVHHKSKVLKYLDLEIKSLYPDDVKAESLEDDEVLLLILKGVRERRVLAKVSDRRPLRFVELSSLFKSTLTYHSLGDVSVILPLNKLLTRAV